MIELFVYTVLLVQCSTGDVKIDRINYKGSVYSYSGALEHASKKAKLGVDLGCDGVVITIRKALKEEGSD